MMKELASLRAWQATPVPAGKYFRDARLLPKCHNRDAGQPAGNHRAIRKTVMEIRKIRCETAGIADMVRVRSKIRIPLVR
jgi:hypothetical protein